ncbi:MAG: EamA family transporter [Lachnospiraceae bacterium]|nr:EamA family transporter [Lachnospiraceae bacterium]
MNKQKRAKLLLSLSMIIFGTLGVFTRNIAVTSGELALYRAILAAVLIMGYFLITGQRIDLKSIKKELLLLLFSGMAMGINWILLFEAYKHTTISAATLSYYFAPVIVTLVCPILFHEKLGKKQLICFLMSTLGLVLVIGFENLGDGNHVLGILLGLGAAVFYATVILLNKFIKNVEGIHRTFLQFLAAIAILVPYVLITGDLQIGMLDGKGWVCLLTVGLLHTGITYCMYFSALKELKGQEIAILSYLDPLVAVAISFFILGEPMTIWQMLGGVLILGFTLWNEK